MNRWRCFLDSLSTDGGHIFVLLYLIMVGIGVFFYDATAGGTIAQLSFGALLKMLVDKGTNRDQLGTTTTATATTQTSPPTPPSVPPAP